MTTYAGTVGQSRRRVGAGPAWVSPEVEITGQLGNERTTAQVQPAAFTLSMMRAAQELGAELRLGEATCCAAGLTWLACGSGMDCWRAMP